MSPLRLYRNLKQNRQRIQSIEENTLSDAYENM